MKKIGEIFQCEDGSFEIRGWISDYHADSFPVEILDISNAHDPLKPMIVIREIQ